jgi:hypothetical protein
VKYWISILAVAAIVALGAPAAFGAGSSLPWDTEVGPMYLTHHVKKQDVSGKLTPATLRAQIAKLKRQVNALAAKNKALAVQKKALGSEAKYQADRNAALANWIGELNKRLLQYEPPKPADPVDPDQECKEYSVCTPEQDCRINGYNCPIAQPVTPPVDVILQNDSATTDATATAASGTGSDAVAQQTPDSATYLDDSSLYQDC